MPTLYEALLFAHVVGAIVWIGGAAMHLALMQLAKRSGSRADMLKLLGYDDRLGPVLYIPAGLLVLLAGIGLVLEGGWEWDQGWIIAGLVLLGVAFVGGAAYFLPAGKRLQRALASHGEESEAVGRIIVEIERVALIDLVLLLAAVYVMTAKPGL
jgi:uncharacterized membrane protein